MDAPFSSSNRYAPDFTAQAAPMVVAIIRAATHDLGHRAGAIRIAAGCRSTTLSSGGSGRARGDVSPCESNERRSCSAANTRARELCRKLARHQIANQCPPSNVALDRLPNRRHCQRHPHRRSTLFRSRLTPRDRSFHRANSAARHRDRAKAVIKTFFWTEAEWLGRFFEWPFAQAAKILGDIPC